jgi:hypothetical protein
MEKILNYFVNAASFCVDGAYCVEKSEEKCYKVETSTRSRHVTEVRRMVVV